ncbi:hypothetical protein C900_05839 [Fulvivirga imtechensis AK7]|uniref:DUF4304 domain-containing protein n=1 Tax=Fulvivirga imtechensis AK7 TaxID=1237149 RepID=L8JIX3_9BACT|nr:hypothetical protein [Fulvivirga imtechensis]ELR68826.1 hypothetical protein C900_05839 [Fulvivirga imtechensis AK7]
MEPTNEIISANAKEYLRMLGFSQSGIHHYKHDPPNIMVIHKKTVKGAFEGLYIALTHDFLENTKRENGDIRIPSYLEEFPVSISIELLPEQYKRHKTPVDFKYDLNFLTREVLPTRRHSKNNFLQFLRFSQMRDDSHEMEEYIHSSMEVLSHHGMQLFDEFTPEISYHAVTRYEAEHPALEQFRKELERYFLYNSKPIPKKKMAWFKRFWAN